MEESSCTVVKRNPVEYLEEIYTLDVSGSTATWTLLSNVGDVPPGRRHFAMAAFSDGTLVMFGGFIPFTVVTWSQKTTAGDVPSARGSATPWRCLPMTRRSCSAAQERRLHVHSVGKHGDMDVSVESRRRCALSVWPHLDGPLRWKCCHLWRLW